MTRDKGRNARSALDPRARLTRVADLRYGGGCELPVVAIDPSVDNLRARRAYARAGFGNDALVDTAEGAAMLMTFGG
jgi:hypothetical protein